MRRDRLIERIAEVCDACKCSLDEVEHVLNQYEKDSSYENADIVGVKGTRNSYAISLQRAQEKEKELVEVFSELNRKITKGCEMRELMLDKHGQPWLAIASEEGYEEALDYIDLFVCVGFASGRVVRCVEPAKGENEDTVKIRLVTDYN